MRHSAGTWSGKTSEVPPVPLWTHPDTEPSTYQASHQ